MERKLTSLRVLLVLLCCAMFSCTTDDLGGSVGADGISVKLISPSINSEDVDVYTTFEWKMQGFDGNLDDLVYDVYIGQKESSLSPIIRDNVGTTCDLGDAALQKGVVYYWKVVAKDGDNEYESRVYSFTVVALDEMIIKTPATNSSVYGSATFTWKELPAVEGVHYTYTVYAGDNLTDPDLVQEIELGSAKDTDSFTLEDVYGKLADNTEYYWYVVATDGANFSTSERKTFKSPKKGHPAMPIITAPEANTLFQNGERVTLKWSECTEPDGGNVLYDVYLASGNTISMSSKAKSLAANSLDIDLSTYDDAIYSWRVDSRDNDGDVTSSSTSYFVVSEGEVKPLMLHQLPEVGVLDIDDEFEWEDAGEGYTYTLWLSNNGGAFAEVADAKNLTVTKSAILNKYFNGNIVDGINPYSVKVIAKNSEGDIKESFPITFKPKLQGTFLDKRAGGLEVEEYKWARIGTQVWLSEGLHTGYLTDGTPLNDMSTENLGVTGNTSNSEYLDGSLNTHYCILPDNLYELVGSGEVTSSKSQYQIVANFTQNISIETYMKNCPGYYYSLFTAANELIAPEGWHVCEIEDFNTLFGYLGLGMTNEARGYVTACVGGKLSGKSIKEVTKHLLVKDLDGYDTYGLSLCVAPSREWNGTSATSGWRSTLWDQQGSMWTLNRDLLDAQVADPATVLRVSQRWTYGQTSDNSNWPMGWEPWSPCHYFQVRCVKE